MAADPPPPHFFPQYQEQEAGIIFPRTLPQNVSLALSDFTEAFTEKEQASSYGALLQNKDFATSHSGCQSAVSLFSLWNEIASRETPLSLHHPGISREQRAASAEQTARCPWCHPTTPPTALSADYHDSMGKLMEAKH